MENDCGVAYTFLMIGILLIIASIVWAFLAIGVNPLIGIHNTYVQNGQVSVQSASLARWAIAFLLGIPGIAMIGLWLAGVIRSIEVSTAGGFG